MSGKATRLVIIESPAKARSLREYLGDDYEVVASNGHVRDLPENRLAVDVENGFRPTYTILADKRKTVRELKRRADGFDRIYLAADPDREGEAICWHIAEILAGGDRQFRRLRFNAVTRETVLKAVRKPGGIDMKLVDAQQARRVMDRLVGYRVSGWLHRVMGKGGSAGRVQTVALRIVQEREDEIREFVPLEYWTVETDVVRGESRFRAALSRLDGRKADTPEKAPRDEAEAEAVLDRLRSGEAEWRVSSVRRKSSRRRPSPPFITSSLQQSASSRLSVSPSRTMRLAQELYEGVEVEWERRGLITYMRTDSVRISPEAISACREYLGGRFGKDALHPSPRRYRSSPGSHDAHEAIRPVDIELTPERAATFLSGQKLRLYSMIWRRFASTQMADAVVARTTVTVSGEGMELVATGESLESPGYTVIDPRSLRLRDPLPPLSEGEVSLSDPTATQCFTKPPQRFTEAGLVAEMKKLGIGRPSTYVSTIATLRKRKYVEKDGRSLAPTELGTATVGLLVRMFPHIFEVGFTAGMEKLLDDVARGEKSYVEALSDLNMPLEASLAQARKELPSVREDMQESTGETCPTCGSPLVVKWGRFGRFVACTGFPSCRYSRQLESETPQVFEGRECPRCGGRLVLRRGRYGRFLSCERGRECGHSEPVPTGVSCPVEGCDGELVERRSSRRRKLFYGCNRYPDCDYALWNEPVGRMCPRCGFPILEKRKKGVWCPRCKKRIEG